MTIATEKHSYGNCVLIYRLQYYQEFYVHLNAFTSISLDAGQVRLLWRKLEEQQ